MITTREQKGSELTFEEVDGNFLNLQSALIDLANSVHYEHQQPSASTTWTINHNRNRKVSVDLFSVGGAKIVGGVTNINLNQSIASFDTPIAGYAIVK